MSDKVCGGTAGSQSLSKTVSPRYWADMRHSASSDKLFPISATQLKNSGSGHVARIVAAMLSVRHLTVRPSFCRFDAVSVATDAAASVARSAALSTTNLTLAMARLRGVIES